MNATIQMSEMSESFPPGRLTSCPGGRAVQTAAQQLQPDNTVQCEAATAAARWRLSVGGKVGVGGVGVGQERDDGCCR